jgi:segregation and condensation protein B
MNLDAQIEAILFYEAEPIAVKKLAELLSVREETILEALGVLTEKLNGRGLTLVRKDDAVMLGTAPEAGQLIENLRKEELAKDLGKAALETLSVILYRGPISRPDIDYIRGVNSSFILRNLLVRGLVEREAKPNDARLYLYKPSFELLSYLGISRLEDLPEYEAMKEKIETFAEKNLENDQPET